MPGDAEQLDGQPDGQRVRRRFEAALDTLPGGTAGTLATQGGGGWGAQAHPAPNPYQALGLVGRYRHGLCRPRVLGSPRMIWTLRAREEREPHDLPRVAGQ